MQTAQDEKLDENELPVGIPAAAREAILSYAKKEWPDDIGMQRYCVKEEVNAFHAIASIDQHNLPQEWQAEIAAEATDHESFVERYRYINDEVASAKEIQEFVTHDIPREELDRIKQKAQAEYKAYFEGQRDFIKQECAAYLSRRTIRKRIDPIKRLLIELERIIGSECYNGNIQNYGPWGEYEGEGRSYRYPVSFPAEDKTTRRWTIETSTPSEELMLGCYKFGANQLSIFRALEGILKHLENNYGVDFRQLETERGQEKATPMSLNVPSRPR